jgi:hypothetical protein
LAGGFGTSAYGGAGDDTMLYNARSGLGDYNPVVVDGGEGNDTINVTSEFGPDFSGNETSGVVSAGADNDTVDVSADGAQISGEAGDDRIVFGADGDPIKGRLSGGDGNDTITASDLVKYSRISGGAGDDAISLDQRNVNAQDGMVTIFGSGFDDKDTDVITLDLNVAQQQSLADGTTEYTYQTRASGESLDQSAHRLYLNDDLDSVTVALHAPMFASEDFSPFEDTQPILEMSGFAPGGSEFVLDLSQSEGISDISSVDTRLNGSGMTELVIRFVDDNGTQGDAVIDLGEQAADFDIARAITVLLPQAA